ncbi:MAG: DUF2256 domain-containing protein [Myxococcota bacterium]
MNTPPRKRCLRCARPFSDRKAIRDFATIQYCSKGCRSRRFTGKRRAVARAVVECLDREPAPLEIDIDQLVEHLSMQEEADWPTLVAQVVEAMSEHGEVRMRKR